MALNNYRGRRVKCDLSFNGKNVTKILDEYMEDVTFTDVASGSSDSISITLADIKLLWIGDWYPEKGDKITGGIWFRNWDQFGVDYPLNLGTFILDEIRFSGNPTVANFSGMACPADCSFTTRQRTKTWENVTVRQIAQEIASRYKLKLEFNGPDENIESLEQTNRTDSDFLYNTVKDYGLKMKVYNQSIVIFDMGKLEAKAPVMTIKRHDFVNDSWDYQDELLGTYTGAIGKYKAGDDSDEEIEVKVGRANEDDPKCRVMYMNTKFDSESEAIKRCKAKVDEANESMTIVSGDIWPNRKMCSGITVMLKGLGRADGKYLVDKVTTRTGDGTKQHIEMHKVYARLTQSNERELPENRKDFEGGCGHRHGCCDVSGFR